MRMGIPHHIPQILADADKLLQSFESWLEPQLAEGEPLSYLAGWANKLAGAIARISGILHMAQTIGEGESWQQPISAKIVADAIRIGRDYLLQHAQAAFGKMGADIDIESARRVLAWIVREKRHSFQSMGGTQ